MSVGNKSLSGRLCQPRKAGYPNPEHRRKPLSGYGQHEGPCLGERRKIRFARDERCVLRVDGIRQHPSVEGIPEMGRSDEKIPGIARSADDGYLRRIGIKPQLVQVDGFGVLLAPEYCGQHKGQEEYGVFHVLLFEAERYEKDSSTLYPFSGMPLLFPLFLWQAYGGLHLPPPVSPACHNQKPFI